MNSFWTLLFFGLLNSLPAQAQVTPCNACNLILISIDTLGAKHVGVYNPSLKTTPNLDEFAKNTVVYENAYAASTWTLPSHAALLTGIFPWRTGLTSPINRIPERVPYMPKYLMEKGYETAAFTSGVWVTQDYGFDRGFKTFEEITFDKHSSELFDKASQWLSKNGDKKFFLFLRPYAVHDPYQPKAEYANFFNPDYKGGINAITTEMIGLHASGRTVFLPAELPRMEQLYHAGIREFDAFLGRFFDDLRSKNLLKNTVVIVTSDHGEEFGEHGYWGVHCYSLYNELLRVPLLLYIPNQAKKRIHSNVSLVDIFPTVANVLGITMRVPGHIFDGQPLPNFDNPSAAKRAVFAQTQVEKEPLFFDMASPKNGRARPSPKDAALSLFTRAEKAILVGDKKLILKRDLSFELFDLKLDPGEKKNRVTTDRSAEMLKTRLLQEN